MKEFATYKQPKPREQHFGYTLDLPHLQRAASEQVQRTDTVLKKIDTTLTLNDQFEDVQRLQNRWDTALGNKTKDEVMLSSNYNPVLARWNYERMTDHVQKDAFRQNEMKNIETALRERNQTAESRLTFTFDKEGKVRNEMFPDEPYEKMLERGRVYREKHGSKETIREKAEIDGFQKIQDAFSDKETPVGTKYVMISPPSQQKDSIYSHNFVDIYELGKDKKSGERVINYTRFASSLEYDQYESAAKELDKTYFVRKELHDEEVGKNQPLDAWYLGNPLKVTGDSLSVFEKDKKAMEENLFHELWKTFYFPSVLYYLDVLTSDKFDPVRTAEAYNTVLQSGENKELMKKIQNKTIFSRDNVTLDNEMRGQFGDLVNQFGRQQVQERKVGCGSSGGVAIGGGDILRNSVAQFGVPGKESTQEWFTCPKCEYKADGPIGNKCPALGCGLTKEEYAKTAAVVCD